MEEKMNKMPFDVPAGYFESLQTRLSSIASPDETLVVKPSMWQKVSPYLAVAAAFAFILTAGTVVLKSTVSGSAEDMDMVNYSQMIPQTDPYSIYSNEQDPELTISEEDVEQFLINTGTSAEHIEYLSYNEK